MITYEIALKLEKAGFPQKGDYWYEKDAWIYGSLLDGWRVFHVETDRAHGETGPLAPTLSEIIKEYIEINGTGLQITKTKNGDWAAHNLAIPIGGMGDMPEEAVVNLYIATKNYEKN